MSGWAQREAERAEDEAMAQEEVNRLMKEYSQYEINRELVLSTAHIPEIMAKLFDRWDHGSVPGAPCNFSYDSYDYGWRIYVPKAIDAGDDTEYPLGLRRLVALARRLRCKWLVLDCDGNKHDHLPIYDW